VSSRAMGPPGVVQVGGGEQMPQEFHYRVPWRSSGSLPGAHASRRTGPGVEFHEHVSLLQTSDPRRFDVLATMRDPQRSLRLKVYRQLGSIPITALIDVSASMPAAAGGSLDLVADFVASLGFSAARTGDSFGVVACDEQVRRDLLLLQTRRRGAGILHAQRLRRFTPDGNGAAGLLSGVHYLPRHRGLVFLVSDFHFPVRHLERLLDALGHHDVVPVPIWSEAERVLPPFGLLRLRDAETGGERLLFMRPGLARRVREEVEAHRAEALSVFRRHGRRPLMLGATFRAQTVSRYFHG
jgi:uncharacterized protein (DUF58 family)